MSTATATQPTTGKPTTTSRNPTTAPNYSWESGPMILIPTPAAENGQKDKFTLAASEMALVHNCLIRAFNSIYLQAPYVPASEQGAFLAYCLATHQGLVAHHHSEEDFLFPEIERITGEKGLMDDNVQGHREFEERFTEWGTWLEGCIATAAATRGGDKNNKEATTPSFSPTTCRAMMDAFMTPLATHLAAEIPTLLALSRFGATLDLAGLLAKEGEQVMGSMSKTTQLPLFLLNHDTSFEGGMHSFPPVPPPVRYMLREVFGRWQARWWQFATCGFDGAPRELKFLGKEKA